MSSKLTVTCPADFIQFSRESTLQGIHERIEDQARGYPGKLAVKTPQAAYTYAEMNGFANSIAAEILSASGTGLAQAVILQPNTPEIVLSILASLKAHKAYVPLDPKLPKERAHAILKDVEPVALLTDDAHIGLAEELAGNRVPIINTSLLSLDAAAPNPRVPCDPLDRAYILYTSGTTGRPKGIAFLHRNLLHHIMCMTNALYFAPSDRVSWLHSASFSASVVDLYCALANGGTLYPWDAKTRGFTGMARWFSQERLTTLQWIPSAFRQFLRTVPDDFVFQDTRMVVMASEPLTVREVELFRGHFPEGSYLVNQVGTSESYNYRLYVLDRHLPVAGASVPAGYPVSEEREVLILDEDHLRLPVGGVGEIAVKSAFMSAGYWHDEALSRERFVRLAGEDIPVYLTGDVGKLEPDGCLIHLGRKDSQVKIRGYRVELAEIDHVLTQVLTHATGIADSTTRVLTNQNGENQLISYLLLSEPAQFNQPELEKRLESRLPEYMVPRKYVVLDSFPTLPNGKIDYKALPDPFRRMELPVRPVALTAPPLEREIASLFAEVLQLEHVGADANFLAEGGDSLLTALLLHRIQQRFGVEISMDEFLHLPTTDHLAGLVRTALQAGPGKSRIPAAEPERSPSWPRGRRSPRQTPRRDCPSTPGNLVIIGAGQFGREIFTWAVQAIAAGAPWTIKGFLDDKNNALDGYSYEAGILGDIESYEIAEDDVFIGAVGDPRAKVKCYSPILEKGGRFVNLIHPLANIGKNVRLGSGIVAAPFSSITCDVTIGDHVSIGALSNLGHDTAIGDWCHISSHCGINGCATLGEGVFLGSHACIIPGVAVGPWAFVGAGSIVVRTVEPAVKVFGNPAAPIGKVNRFEDVATCRKRL